MRLFGNFNTLEIFHRNRLGVSLWHTAHPDRGKGAVLQNGQMWEQVEMLEHHANLAADLVDVLQIIVEGDALYVDIT